MSSLPDRSPIFYRDLVTSLVGSATGTSQREHLARLLPRLDSVALADIENPDDRVQARAYLAEAFLVALGPDAAHRELTRALDDSDSIPDKNGKAATLAQAAGCIAALGTLGIDLLARVEGHAAALDVTPDRARLFATLAVAYSRAREEKRADKMAIRSMNSAEKIDDDCERVEAFTLIATELQKQRPGDATDALDRALTVAEGIADADSRVRSLLMVAGSLARSGRADDGLAALEKAVGKRGQDTEGEASAPANAVVIDDVEAAEIATDPANSPDVPEGYVLGEDGGVYVDPTAGANFPKFTSTRRKGR